MNITIHSSVSRLYSLFSWVSMHFSFLDICLTSSSVSSNPFDRFMTIEAWRFSTLLAFILSPCASYVVGNQLLAYIRFKSLALLNESSSRVNPLKVRFISCPPARDGLMSKVIFASTMSPILKVEGSLDLYLRCVRNYGDCSIC